MKESVRDNIREMIKELDYKWKCFLGVTLSSTGMSGSPVCWLHEHQFPLPHTITIIDKVDVHFCVIGTTVPE